MFSLFRWKEIMDDHEASMDDLKDAFEYMVTFKSFHDVDADDLDQYDQDDFERLANNETLIPKPKVADLINNIGQTRLVAGLFDVGIKIKLSHASSAKQVR